jgi:hypothetical protein
MRNQFDIAAYTPSNELILVAEVKGLKESDEGAATFFRRNLLAHGLLPVSAYFLLAYRTTLYLWSPKQSPEASPEYRAAAKPIFKRFLGDVAELPNGAGPQSLEFAIKAWLDESAREAKSDSLESDADRMIVRSGLLERLKGAEVRREVVL